MEREEVGTDNPVLVAGVTVIPVTKVSLNCQHHGGGVSLFGLKQPVSVVGYPINQTTYTMCIIEETRQTHPGSCSGQV